MKWYYNMKISTKLLTGFILVSLIAGLMGVFGIINMNNLNNSDTELYEKLTVPISEMSDISTAFQRMRVKARDTIMATSESNMNANINDINTRRAEIDKLSAEFEKTIMSDRMREAFKKFTDAKTAYRPLMDKVIELAKANRDNEAAAMLSDTGEAGKASRAEQDAIANIIALKVEDAKNKADSNTNQANSTMLFMGILIAVAMGLSIILGIFISRIISKPLKQAVHMIKEMSLGHLGMRLKMDTKDEIGQMAAAMDGFADDLQDTVIGTMMKISEGDVSAEIISKDEKDEISPALKATIENIRALVAETGRLIKATQEGKLDTRGNAAGYKGSWGEMINGVNNLIDAFVGPINVTAEYVDRISKGDIPPKITDTYLGDFNEIKNNLNNCIDIMSGLLTETNKLIQATKEGKLDTRGDAKAFVGGWGELVGGVNAMIDAFVGPINVTAEYVDRISKGDIPPKITDIYLGDFNEIKNNLNNCIDIMNGLLTETNKLIQAAIEGKLGTRANTSGFAGGWNELVAGVNKILEAVIEPVREAASVLNKMSNGNLQMRVTGNYNGDYAEIKNALNETLDALSGYVDEISNVLTEMANSNMMVEISGDYKGDFAPIKQALNLIIESFNQVLSDINNAADQVAAGSRQVSDGSQALSQGATEQASSIEQLTASITEIAAQTKQNAVSANEANDLALTAKNNAADGNDQMKDMLKSMEEINISSANISKIIKVIDEIAFQTNILALNAAVEAARAGQHGKGFAVVAEEVRNLAARSASAAKETTVLIEGSIKKVETGTKIANETAVALDKIVNDVAKAANLVGTIATASNEQATGIAQVNQGVEQVSMVVQTNSATAEESAAASEELSSQADMLKELIGSFKLKNGESQSVKSHHPESGMKRMLPDGGAAKRQISDNRNSRKDSGVRKNVKIALSDGEFGKY